MRKLVSSSRLVLYKLVLEAASGGERRCTKLPDMARHEGCASQTAFAGLQDVLVLALAGLAVEAELSGLLALADVDEAGAGVDGAAGAADSDWADFL